MEIKVSKWSSRRGGSIGVIIIAPSLLYGEFQAPPYPHFSALNPNTLFFHAGFCWDGSILRSEECAFRCGVPFRDFRTAV